ncbi:phosphotransferase family protein [Ilumatobacter nonamiensis]|uniref:phosphotransferase family protein n=1 Tax=Ilumatobacter nonamiensis TaxID=467093 RepID=UPI000344A2A7|nr:phosphotransferase [Ilumatobacter nonamiensis]
MKPDQITPEWLSEVLGADVSEIRTERIGDGLVGLNLRVSTGGAVGAPDSVVIKLPSLDETSRATGIALRNYECEVKFYEHIASTVDIRVPHCHHGEWDEESGDFVLVLEDMAPAEQGDQVTGCDVETARLAVVELAQLHGPRWADDTLFEHEFLSRRTGTDDGEQLGALWAMFLPGFSATYSKYLDPASQQVLDEFGPRLVEWVAGGDSTLTVTHGDYRLDNLLFGTPEGGPPVTAVDWQTPGHGPPINDVAYFCGAGLQVEDRRAAERDLLDAYRAALLEHGVEVDAEWLWGQYRRQAFAGVIMSVVASQIVGGSDRSEAMFAAMATRHLQHCVDLDSLDVI